MKILRKTRSEEPVSVCIETDYIKLESFLKLANAVSSGGMAKNFIQNGEVQVNGEVCTARGRKLYAGDSVVFEQQCYLVRHVD